MQEPRRHFNKHIVGNAKKSKKPTYKLEIYVPINFAIDNNTLKQVESRPFLTATTNISTHIHKVQHTNKSKSNTPKP